MSYFDSQGFLLFLNPQNYNNASITLTFTSLPHTDAMAYVHVSTYVGGAHAEYSSSGCVVGGGHAE